MTHALDALFDLSPEEVAQKEMWSDALRQAAGLSAPARSGKEGESAIDRMHELRSLIDAELVAFHDGLHVTPYEGGALRPGAGAKLWRVGVPITLFPKRDMGFYRVECIVTFSVNGGAGSRVAIRQLFPEERSEVMASAQLGAKLQVRTRAGGKLSASPADGLLVAEAAKKVWMEADASAELTAGAEVAAPKYKIVRECGQSEIINGFGARWRLEDRRDVQRVRLEGHQLAVVIEVPEGVGSVDAAGYLQAYSSTAWLTAHLGDLWRDFVRSVAKFFNRGAPTEAYAEWKNVIPESAPVRSAS
jgi:hypothetical protein